MESLNIILGQLLSPPILFFALGMFATIVKSDLKIPSDMGIAMMLFLLIAIGLEGGVGISNAGAQVVLAPAIAAVVLGISIVVAGFFILSKFKFGAANAGSIAGHYGAVSAATMLIGFSFLDRLGIYYEPFISALYPLMDSPAIITAILLSRITLARQNKSGVRIKPFKIIKKSLFGKAVLILLASLVIGYASGAERTAEIMPFFDGMFKGVLCIFMLDLGLLAAGRIQEWKTVGVYLALYAFLMPLIHGIAGVFLGSIAGLSVGGSTMLGILAASTSFISAPAALRAAIPEANPSLSLTAAIGLTFPFNVVIGIPFYYTVALMFGG